MARTLLASLAILLASLSASAFPDGPRGFGHGAPPDEIIARHAAELGIPGATVSQIRTLAEQHRAETEVMVKELRAQKRALREKLRAGQPDESEVIALARTIGTLETDLSVARLTSMMRIHALLTPEQNEALREKMRGRFQERRALLDQALAACDAEIAAHCPDELAEGGPPGLGVGCLMHRRRTEEITLSAGCEQALRELPRPHIIRHRLRAPGDGGEKFDVLVAPPPDELEERE
jgi:Spy/CpxP family protein refolding chaperone